MFRLKENPNDDSFEQTISFIQKHSILTDKVLFGKNLPPTTCQCQDIFSRLSVNDIVNRFARVFGKRICRVTDWRAAGGLELEYFGPQSTDQVEYLFQVSLADPKLVELKSKLQNKIYKLKCKNDNLDLAKIYAFEDKLAQIEQILSDPVNFIYFSAKKSPLFLKRAPGNLAKFVTNSKHAEDLESPTVESENETLDCAGRGESIWARIQKESRKRSDFIYFFNNLVKVSLNDLLNDALSLHRFSCEELRHVPKDTFSSLKTAFNYERFAAVEERLNHEIDCKGGQIKPGFFEQKVHPGDSDELSSPKQVALFGSETILDFSQKNSAEYAWEVEGGDEMDEFAAKKVENFEFGCILKTKSLKANKIGRSPEAVDKVRLESKSSRSFEKVDFRSEYYGPLKVHSRRFRHPSKLTDKRALGTGNQNVHLENSINPGKGRGLRVPIDGSRGKTGLFDDAALGTRMPKINKKDTNSDTQKKKMKIHRIAEKANL